MGESKHIQDPKTGKLLGSIGVGKENVPSSKPKLGSATPEAKVESQTTGAFDTKALLTDVTSARETLETAAALGAKISGITGSSFYEIQLFETYREESSDYRSLKFYASRELAEEALAKWIMDSWHSGRSVTYSPWTSGKYEQDMDTPEWDVKAAEFAKSHSALEIISFYFDIPANQEKYVLGEEMYGSSNGYERYEIVENKISKPSQNSSVKWEIAR